MPPADPTLPWSVLCLPKRGNSEDEYEDAWAGDPAAGRFAVADGASESSFAGLWAQLLAEGFLSAPRPEDMPRWLAGPERRWAAEVMGLELPWYAEMKREQGAFATFARPGRIAADGGSARQMAGGGRRRQLFVPGAPGTAGESFPIRKAADFGKRAAPARLARRAGRRRRNTPPAPSRPATACC